MFKIVILRYKIQKLIKATKQGYSNESNIIIVQKDYIYKYICGYSLYLLNLLKERGNSNGN